MTTAEAIRIMQKRNGTNDKAVISWLLKKQAAKN
jgi:hypothetical protein